LSKVTGETESRGAKFMSPPEAGQLDFLKVAKFVSMLVSLYIRVLKNWHSAWPMVCAPDRTVRSFRVRPLFLNMVVSVDRSEDGAGIWLFAALWLAVLASLLPSGTTHEGPPSYKLINWNIVKYWDSESNNESKLNA